MRTIDFDYELPRELIAQDPIDERSSSRLLLLDRKTGHISHAVFRDIVGILEPGDLLVLNDTKVIPARLIGVRTPTGGSTELLLLRRIESDTWECLARPARRLKEGARVSFGDGMLLGEIEGEKEGGLRTVKFSYEGIFEEILLRLGEMPLPPYITHRLRDPDRYQTVYAARAGSAAAPTAGLHFTNELLSKIEARGIRIAKVTLHVGLGTFRPVEESEIEEHTMHSEYYEIDAAAADLVNMTLSSGHRVITAGTTSTRVLEAASEPGEEFERLRLLGEKVVEIHGLEAIEIPASRTESAAGRKAPEGVGTAGRIHESAPGPRYAMKYLVCPRKAETDIFIYPGYEWKATGGLITNFHLPKSTLLMLVSAFAGRENVLSAYREAIDRRYRFYSFGDAMLIY